MDFLQKVSAWIIKTGVLLNELHSFLVEKKKLFIGIESKRDSSITRLIG